MNKLKYLFNQSNEIFTQAKTGKRISHPIIAFFLVPLIIIIGSVTIELFIIIKLLNKPEFSSLTQKLISFLVTVPFVLFLLWCWVHFFEKRKFSSIGLYGINGFKKFAKGFGYGMLMLSLTVILILFFTKASISFSGSPNFMSKTFLPAILMLIAYVVQGSIEEIIARGWHFQVLGVRLRPWLGALLSTIVFVLLHAVGLGILSAINLTLFSLFLVIMVLKDGNIWAACGWHAAWNWTMEIIFGLKVSGETPVASFLKINLEGKDMITGGAFGPEGSIFATIVFIFAITISLLNLKNNKE